MIDPVTGEDYEPRPFDQTLRELSEGQTNDELSSALHDVIKRVQATGKAGSVTLTIGVAFDGAGRIKMTDKVASKLPEFDRPVTAFYIDRQGNPSRRDPNQPELPNVTQLNRKDASNA